MTRDSDAGWNAAPKVHAAPKVCVASSGLGHVARGIEAWAKDLGDALATRGTEVILCKGGGFPEADHERVIRCLHRESDAARRVLDRVPRRVGWRIGAGSPYEVEQTSFAWNLLPVLRRQRVDVLHVQDPLVALIVQRAAQLRLVRCRAVLAHGTEEPFWFQRKFHHLQHLAPWHARRAERAGVSRATWTTIPNFIDVTTFRPGSSPPIRQELGLPADALVILVAAAIKRKHKRIDHVLDEFERLRRSAPDVPAYLVVAGGWSHDSDELIREGTVRLGERVRFLVRFPRHRMPDLYRAADLFLLGSLKEMMPIALLEATASGLPCVVHAHPVMEWMIGPGGAAIDLRQPGTLARRLEELLRSPETCRDLGRRGRRHCEIHFARDPVVDRIVDHYRLVTRGPKDRKLGDDRPADQNAGRERFLDRNV